MIDTKFKKGQPPWNKGKKEVQEAYWKGKKRSKETIDKIKQSKKGQRVSSDTEFKKGNIPWNKGKKLVKNPKIYIPRKRKDKIYRIPILCACGCNEVIWDKRGQYKRGHSNLGIKHTEEFKNRLSKLRKIKPNKYWLGKKRSEKTKNKIAVALQGEKSNLWIDGRSFLPYCSKFNKQLKERIRERDNRTCQLCGVKENGKKLDVHHVHYDKENCEPDLVALCNSCNLKVNFNREFYEKLFMNILNERKLLFWTKQ